MEYCSWFQIEDGFSLFFQADVTPNKIKKLQSTYENKVTELVHSLKKCQNENDLLKREVESATRDLKKLEFLKTENESLKEQ